MRRSKRAVILLSGGLDSATTLYFAKDKGFEPLCLIFDYGQRHKKEIERAKKIARHARCLFKVVKLAFPNKGSALLNKKISIPKKRSLRKILKDKIPSTYVPARNIIFLSIAVSYAETIKAKKIFIGANARDYSGYPDCRPEFFKAFSKVLLHGAKSGIEGDALKIETPLINKTKAQIIKLGLKLKVPYRLSWSCYQGKNKPCGECDSCILRTKGFSKLKMKDPILC